MCLQEKQRDNRHDIRRRKDQEKCLEQNQSLYILFVHLTKAFDTVGRWVGHVLLMDDTHLPKMVFFSEVASGTRSIGHPLKRFKESLKQKTESNPTLRWEPSPQTATPEEWPFTRAFKALKRAAE